ncbi:MAG: MFS transporter [Caldilineaceae bacterium]|nr:MFS transporter [Caldilineaceae bacterium]
MVGKFERLPWLQELLAPLAIPDYRRLVGSNTLWWQTLQMEMVVMGWLVLELTDSTWAVAVVGFFRTAPMIPAGFLVGPIADRFGRRPVIIACQTVNLLMYGLIVLLLAMRLLALWHLAAISFVLGLAWAIDFPTRRSLLPDMVGKTRIMDALLLESFAGGISRIVGPFLAGLIIVYFGAFGCFLVLTALSLCALMLLRTLTQSELPRTATPGISAWSNILEGFRYVRHNEPILAVILITLFMNLLIFPYMTLLPTFARDVLQQGPEGLGLLGTATGIGSFIGLLVINGLRRRVNSGMMYAVGSFFQCLGLVAFAASTFYPLSWLLLLLAGIGQSCFALMQSSIILLTASDEMRDRAMGTVMIGIGVDPLGKLQTGFLAESYGAPIALGLQAGLSALLVAGTTLLLPQLWKTPRSVVV